MSLKKKKYIYIALCILSFIFLIYLSCEIILTSFGRFLVINEKPVKADAVLVLNTGIEYYPRLIEAASLYNEGYVKKIVINGNRKSDTLKELEKNGLIHCCSWNEDSIRVLELYNVQRRDIISISAEDVYDTITEAETVGAEIAEQGISHVLIVTSKSHTRRAEYIWSRLWGEKLKVKMVSAKDDPFDPGGWWKSGRQIKWVMSEYGAWGYAIFNLISRK